MLRPSELVVHRTYAMRIAAFALALSMGNLVPAHAADVAVTTCGTVVASGDTGILQADLDCSAAPASQPAIILRNRASLSLGGFTLTGAVNGTGVRCARHCVVTGLGTITSAPATGPGNVRAACIRALQDEGETPRSQKLKVEDVSLDGCSTGVLGDTGKYGAKLTLTNVVADGNGVGFMGASIRARGVSATNGAGAGFWVPTGKLTGVDVHADGNDPVGVEAARMSLKDTTAIGNAAFGVLASSGTAKLKNTTVTGSGLVDVLTARPPQVSAVTCGTSARWIPPNGIGESWGVCAND